jgi:GT2 family glycosyltransferase
VTFEISVSIIIPTYKRTSDLDACLDSIIKQTNVPAEIITVDDSEDRSIEELISRRKNEFKMKGSNLLYVRRIGEKSSAKARNLGIEKAKGDIIIFLDSDVILDNDYIAELLKVYQTFPAAQGVQGLITNIKFSHLYNIFYRIFFLSFLEENACRILPSTEMTYPIRLNKIIETDVMSGSNMSFRRSVLKDFRFNESLLSYSYKEDVDLSVAIAEKYPGSLYMTPYAKLIHNVSSEGRLQRKKLIYMKHIYSLYFFYKNIDQTLINKIIFMWSRMGYALFYVVALMINPTRAKWLRLKYLLEAIHICIKHSSEIRSNNMHFFNQMLITKE